MTHSIVHVRSSDAVPATVLGQGPARIPTGGKIRAGTKTLSRTAAESPQARAIYATSDDRDRRNRFYERIRFTFEYQGDREWGVPKPIMGHELQARDFVPREGWQLLEL